ncbi:MAG: hypothetical protein WBE26_03655 [Phycisphaerae bacterium]
MTELTHQQERRSEVRRCAPATRVSWAREDATKTCTGWVSDIATSSISFVTPTRDRPTPGEPIELTLNAGSQLPQHHAVRVARTESHDQLFSLVACRTDATAEHAPTV